MAAHASWQDNLSRGNKEAMHVMKRIGRERLGFLNLDLGDASLLSSALLAVSAAVQIDVVMHFAANAWVGTRSLRRDCKHDCKRMLSF